MSENKSKVVLKFEHNQSAHCENGVVSNLLKYYGVELSEPMVFGIGSGLFFSHMPFLKVGGIPVTSFRPMPGIIFKRISNRLGIKFEKRKFSNPHKAMDALDRNLDQKIPTGMLVGVYHLSYFPDPYRFHFNAHNIVVYGRENDRYLISDPIMEGYESLSYNELMKVRYAKGLFAPKGHMYWAKEVPDKIDLIPAIKKGIEQTCKHMLTIPIPMFGVKGIAFLSKRLEIIQKNWGPEELHLLPDKLLEPRKRLEQVAPVLDICMLPFYKRLPKLLIMKSSENCPLSSPKLVTCGGNLPLLQGV